MKETTRSIIERFGKDRGDLLPLLRTVQEAEGSLSAEAIREISRHLDITENYVYSVASFYGRFRFTDIK